MFKFTITNNSNATQQSFYNGTEELGKKDTYRFLTWLDLSAFNLSLPEIHVLLKHGVSGDHVLTVIECDLVSDLLV